MNKTGTNIVPVKACEKRRGSKGLAVFTIIMLAAALIPLLTGAVSRGAALRGQVIRDIQTHRQSHAGSVSYADADDDWSLILVNPWNSIPDGYSPTLTKLINGQSVDERCYPDLQDMMDDCRAAGLSPLICSSYRSGQTQESLYNNKVKSLAAMGLSQERAKTEAAKVVALPGTSEHQLGLALDIVDVNNQNLDESQEDTEVQKWLMENSYKYGFILRYPQDKSDVTGISYEPWHYRYVGKEAAREIYEQGVCLEEYLESLS